MKIRTRHRLLSRCQVRLSTFRLGHLDGLETWQDVERDAKRVADVWF